MSREYLPQPEQERPILNKWFPEIKKTLVPLGYFLSEQGEARSSTAEGFSTSDPDWLKDMKERRDLLLQVARQCGVPISNNQIDFASQAKFGEIISSFHQLDEHSMVVDEVWRDLLEDSIQRFLQRNPQAEADFLNSDEYRDAQLAYAAGQRRILKDLKKERGDDAISDEEYEVIDYLWENLF